MSRYIAEHADALADVKEYGSAVTFTKTVAGAYDPITDTTSSPTAVSVAGYAVKRKAKSQSDIQKYQSLKLVESSAPYLFFVPNQYGNEPPLGSSVSWQGEAYITRDIDTLAPDGVAIAAYVVVSK